MLPRMVSACRQIPQFEEDVCRLFFYIIKPSKSCAREEHEKSYFPHKNRAQSPLFLIERSSLFKLRK
jgi:hypothetical protein